MISSPIQGCLVIGPECVVGPLWAITAVVSSELQVVSNLEEEVLQPTTLNFGSYDLYVASSTGFPMLLRVS